MPSTLKGAVTSDSRAAQARELFANLTPIPTPAQPDAIPLYPGRVQAANTENWETQYGDRWVRNVRFPTLTPILPTQGTGTAIVVAPGGSFRALSIDNEGLAVAQWFADRGVAAFVLKYQVIETPADTATFSAMIGDLMTGEATAEDLGVLPEALADGQQAVRLVRGRAGEWGVDPTRIGFVGFSAGAITAIAVAP